MIYKMFRKKIYNGQNNINDIITEMENLEIERGRK